MTSVTAACPLSSDDDIVVTGISGQFPNSHNVKEYIDQLLNKVFLCDDDERRGKILHPEIPKVNGKIYDIDLFDAGNFGMHGLHAMYTDSLGRVFLEQVYSALFDAGIHPDELKGSNTGIFSGVCFSEYELGFYGHFREKSNIITGVTRSMNSQKVSYYLQLDGPAYNCDTACSSGMYALVEGYRAIREGRCDRAIIGGANLCIDPYLTLQFFRLGVLNVGGGCRPFDNDAAGYTRSEAIVAVILQKRSEAKRVYADLIHTKVNADGFEPMGISFPSFESQHELLEAIYREANIDPKEIGFLEAHGTGTKVGDTEELCAVDMFFRPTNQMPLLIGSVKGNIGHTEPSSGLCSLVKVLHALNAGQIAPNINFNKPKEGVESLADKRLKVVTKVTPFPEEKDYAALSCFGFGGANAHAVVKKFDKTKQRTQTDVYRLVCYSGRTQAALDAIHGNIVNCNDVEYLALLQESFKINFETHLFRGYTLVGRNLRSSMKLTNSGCNKINLIIGSFKNFRNINLLGNIPIFKTFLTKYQHDLKVLPSETVTLLMFLYYFKELALQIDIFENEFAIEIKKFFNNQLTIQQLSKRLTSQPQIPSKKIIGAWIKANSSYVNDGVIISLGKFDLNGCRHPKTRYKLIEFGDDLTEESCLCNFGKLYELGFNLQVHNLYPTINFPVSRGTDYLSHLLKWRHKTIPNFKFKEMMYVDAERMEGINMQERNLAYLRGHLIDNRNLFPATGYIYYVWKLLADSMCIDAINLSVVFENVTFHRACIIPAYLEFSIIILHNGSFEVAESGSTVVTGTIQVFEEEIEAYEVKENNEKSDADSFVLNPRDAYRELRLRGYNYSGQFRALHEVTSTSAIIKWDREWIPFLDNMMQVCILSLDTRKLYVPVAIQRMVIRANEHTAYVNAKEDKLVPMHFNKETNTIRSHFIEIRGLHAKSITRQKDRLQPVLESYQFIPNEFTTDIATSTRVNVQLLLECKPCESFKVAEIIEANDEPENAIINHICSAIEDLRHENHLKYLIVRLRNACLNKVCW